VKSEAAAPVGGKAIYFDCYSGVSGDMTLGALLDCGVALEDLNRLLAGLALPGYRLQAETVTRYGLAGTRLTVLLDRADTHHRHLSGIVRLIRESSLPEPVREQSAAVFENLAAAEAAVHGIPVEQVHFHEVGAVDAIVDIVGSAAALYLLGVGAVYCSSLPYARGMVRAAHGLLPLPAPATLELIKRRRAPVYGRETEFELVTPTGAAIVTTLAEGFGPPPPMNVEAVGYGAGSLDPGYPNFLRVMLGTRAPGVPAYEERVQLIEANIDDLNPEIYGYLMEKLLAGGAMDVFLTPIQMKKNRPAIKLTVLAAPSKLQPLLEMIFHETSTLGVRTFEGCKIMRPRAFETVQTEWGPVRVKLVPVAGQAMPVHFAPEYEDCLAIARRTGVPLKEVYRQVEYLFRHSRRRPD
jgi:pyridinium-3,5-bisthiocarboxylic acid mononucleotide nickel chelatase